MASPTEPLEDILADNWDEDTSIGSEEEGEAEVQRKNKEHRKNEEPQSPGKPNVETEYVMGSSGKPPKVHLLPPFQNNCTFLLAGEPFHRTQELYIRLTLTYSSKQVE